MTSPSDTAATPSAAAAHPAAPAARGLLSRRTIVIGVAASAAVCLGGMLFWYLIRPAPQTPAQQFAEALKQLENKDFAAARELAKTLEERRYRPEECPGGVEYVLGQAAFGLAETAADPTIEAPYAAAAAFLKEAEHQGLADDYRPAWAFAYGKCQWELGELSTARPNLEEACETYAARRLDAAKMLADLYLDPSWKSPELLDKALTLNASVLAATTANSAEHAAALQQKAEILLAQNHTTESQAVMAEVSRINHDSPDVAVVQARILIQEQRFLEAIDLLAPIAEKDASSLVATRHAQFLMGWAAELSARDDATTPVDSANSARRSELRQRAADYYQKTVQRFERTDEGLAAELCLARLQQEDGAHERALRSYGAVLRTVQRPQDFRNRWLSVEQFRQRILAAWNAWTQTNHFDEAIALSELMTPLFPREQADEYSARAHQRAAETLADELSKATTTVQSRRQSELRQKWHESAAAFERLAKLRRTKMDYSEALWTAAEHYRRAHDFQAAIAQLDRFLAEPDEPTRPVALVRRAQMLLDLDRYEEAAKDLVNVVKKEPTSPAAFHAQWLLGQCALERGRPAEAEAAWRDMIESDRLTPAATEWRAALHSLAKLLTDQASDDRRRALSRPTGDGTDASTLWRQVERRAGEAVRLWETFLARYPTSPQTVEARYLLGKGLQLQAEQLHRHWNAAETDNARQQTKKLLDITLTRAVTSFEAVRDALMPFAQEDRLSAVDAQILQSAWFELPHTLFLVGRYDEAISAYTAAANRHPQDVRVLTAYVQMAQAYAQLGKPVEARSMIEQAKVILEQQQIPTAAFSAPTTNYSRPEWEEWLERVVRMRH